MGGQPATDDAALAAALAADEQGAFADVYQAYADRLFSYAVVQTHDRDAAADVVADTFLLARDRIGQLREPTRLRSWLYAICRNECLRFHRGNARVAALEAAGDMSDESVDFEGSLTAREACTLVADVLPGLNESDRELVELAMRHQLASDEIGAALGISTNQASARLSRAKAQLERALGALAMFRFARTDCAGLAAIADGATFDALTRKRIARHVDGCQACGHRRAGFMMEMSQSYAWPLEPAPTELASQVLASTTGDAAAVGAQTAPFVSGWPAAGGSATRRVLVGMGAAVAGAALLVGLGAAALGTPADPTPQSVASTSAVTPNATSVPVTPVPQPSTATSAEPVPGAADGEVIDEGGVTAIDPEVSGSTAETDSAVGASTGSAADSGGAADTPTGIDDGYVNPATDGGTADQADSNSGAETQTTPDQPVTPQPTPTSRNTTPPWTPKPTVTWVPDPLPTFTFVMPKSVTSGSSSTAPRTTSKG